MRFITKLKPGFAKASVTGPFTAEEFVEAEALDENGVLRLKTRLAAIGKTEPALAQPILLSADSPLTGHIIRRIHEKLLLVPKSKTDCSENHKKMP
jgi:hypothetical protein